MKHLIQISEFERGWDSRIEIEELFDTYEQAIDYAKNYNKAETTSMVAPEVYWLAQYAGIVKDDYKCK